LLCPALRAADGEQLEEMKYQDMNDTTTSSRITS